MPGRPLPRAFYERPAAAVARDLLGCLLRSRVGGVLTAGRIVETEAYLGPEDGASHAAFRPASRKLFYGPGGVAYVYRAYGLHDLLNAVAGPPGTPGCVLIRSAEAVTGLATMARRRDLAPRSPRAGPRLASGPGNLTRALGITRALTGTDLGRGPVTIVAPPPSPPPRVARGPRVGITRATGLPLRFWIAGHPAVSTGPVRGRVEISPTGRAPEGWPTPSATRGSGGPTGRRPRRSGSPGPRG